MATHEEHPAPRQIAPWWHTLGLLLLLLGFASWYVLRVQGHTSPDARIADYHPGNTIIYTLTIAAEWMIVLYIWLGGHLRGALPLRDIIGGRWSSLKSVLLDLAIAAGFFVVWTGAAIALAFIIKPTSTNALDYVHPRGPLQAVLWILMSITAGFCEEIIFRGYLQKQFHAWTRSAIFAIPAQAILFGACHWYQGPKLVLLIAALGSLFGILAHWRKSLRPGMISHAVTDIIGVLPIPLH